MSSFIIEGGRKLKGEILPQGAKNEALQVICATVLTRQEVVIENIPKILDIKNLILLLQDIGVEVRRIDKGKYSFRADSLNEDFLASDVFLQKCSRLRGSVMLIAPLLTRLRRVRFAKPGGDKIGRRRLDTHFIGLQKR